MLTKSAVESAQPRAKPYFVWDDELPGFGCIIHPTGRRGFIVQYRLRGSSKSYRDSIGRYGVVTVAQARKRAADMIAQAQLGHDPRAGAAARKAKAGELTVTELIAQYLDAIDNNRVPSKRLQGRQRSARYRDGIAYHLNNFAKAHGGMAANDITRAQMRLWLDRLVHQPAAHKIAHGTLHRMFDWAIKRDIVTCADPTANIEAGNPPSRERALSVDEVTHLWRATEGLTATGRDAVRLLLLTGQRRGEVGGMVWGEVDLDRATWTLPTERTKAKRAHVLPLPSLAVEALRARCAGTTPAPGDLVFPSLSRTGKLVPLACWQDIKDAIDAKAPLPAWRLHDLRRTFVTLCAEQGMDVATLDSLLNHAASETRRGVIGIYQRATLLEPARVVMRQWDLMLRDALDLPPPDGWRQGVVPLRSEAA